VTRPTLEEVAGFYNERTRDDPSNPPTRQELAAWASVSTATAQKWLDVLEARGQLCYPLRRRGGRLRGRRP